MNGTPAETTSVRLRVELDADAAFLSALACARHRPLLELSGAPPAVIDQLVALQVRGQAESYRMRFPAAHRLIVERGGEPVGRVILDAEEADLYIVDIAICASFQGKGFGGAAVGEIQRDALAAGLGVRALVQPENGASLAMFRRRGFILTGGSFGPSQELRWTA